MPETSYGLIMYSYTIKNQIMKKFTYIALAVAAIMSAGCKEKLSDEGRTGGLQLKIKAEGTYVDKIVKSSESVDLNDFVISVEKKDGKYAKSWAYAELPSLVELSPGEYNVTVVSPETEPVAWEQPSYAATKDFAIVNGVVTPVDMICTLQNMKNSVYCSQHFMDQLTNFNVKISNEDGYLVWTADEVGIYTESDGKKTITKEPSKRAYFSVKELDVNVDGYRELDGTTANLTYEINNVAARDHHIIYLDAYVTGQASMSLRIDASVNDKDVDIKLPGIDPEDGNIDDDIEVGWGEPEGDQPVIPEPSSTAPTVEWPANPDFAKMDIVAGMNVELMVYAPAKIKGFVVRVSDNFLPAIQMLVHGADCLDLIGDPVAIEALGSMLPTGDQLLGKTEVTFSLSSLVPLIASVGNQGEDYVFTLEVTDEKDQQLVKSVTFYNPVTE